MPTSPSKAADSNLRVCSVCAAFATPAPANLSRKTGERLYRSWCVACEKKRKDAWRQANIDKHNEKSRAWVAKNLQKSATSKKRWRDKNQDVSRKLQSAWRKNNPERAHAQVNARRRTLRRATPKCLTELDLLHIAELYHLAQLRKLTVDHTVPLQHVDVCGLHVPWNLELLSANANFTKSNTFNGVAPRSVQKECV